MSLYIVREYLGALLVLIVFIGTVAVVRVVFLLLQEGICRTVRWIRTGMTQLDGR